jgi:hypothetical protein
MASRHDGVAYHPNVQGGTLMHHRLDSILNQIRQDVAKYLSSESIY